MYIATSDLQTGFSDEGSASYESCPNIFYRIVLIIRLPLTHGVSVNGIVSDLSSKGGMSYVSYWFV